MTVELSTLTADIFAVLNIAFALGVVVVGSSCLSRGSPSPWIRLPFLLIALYWAMLYAYILAGMPWNKLICPLTPHHQICPSAWFEEVFVRPAFTLTLALMFANSIQTMKRCKVVEKAVVEFMSEQEAPQ